MLFEKAPKFKGLPEEGFSTFALQDREQRREAIIDTIHPALAGGTLTVLEDVTGTECNPYRPPPIEEPPRNIEFSIGDGNAGPGETVGLPFTIRADRPSQGFEFSVDFDEEVLTATDIVKRWQRPGETSYDFEVFEYNNENRVPDNSWVDEGFLVGAAVIVGQSKPDEEPQ